MTGLLTALKEFLNNGMSEAPTQILLSMDIWPTNVAKDYIGIADGIVETSPHGGKDNKTRDEVLDVAIIAFVPIIRQEQSKVGGASDKGVLWYIERIKDLVQNEMVDHYQFVDFVEESKSQVIPIMDKDGEVKATWLVKVLVTRWDNQSGGC